MNSMKVKDLREIAKFQGLRGYSRLKKSDLIYMIESYDKGIEKCDIEVFGGDFLIEVSEDDCEDLSDYEDSSAKKDKAKNNFSVKVFEDGFTIKVCEDDSEDLPDGW